MEKSNYNPNRSCEQCGDVSPWSTLCGTCEVSNRSSEMAAAQATEAVVQFIDKICDGPGIDPYGILFKDVDMGGKHDIIRKNEISVLRRLRHALKRGSHLL